MRRLKVLHVIGGGDTGGAMTHLLPLLSGLARAECDVTLLCLGGGGLADEAEARGLSVRVLPMSSPWDPLVLPALRAMVVAGGWDVVHTHGMRANLPVRAVFPLTGRRPCLFTTVHSDLLLDYSSPLLARTYQALDRATLGRVDMVVAVSDSLRFLLRQRGYPEERTVRIWSGIEWRGRGVAAGPPSNGGGPELSGEAGRDAMGGAPRRPRLGTVARLAAVKDIALLLEVTALVRRTVPDVECVVVGDGPERAALEAQARGLGLGGPNGAVRFTGRVEQAASALAELDVFVVTSVYEGGVSMSVLEAMAAGLPVVSTAAGGVAEAVEDGVTGFVVSRDRERGALAAALAERAVALLSDPRLRARMGEAGAARVRRLFLAEHAAARTRRAYERCLVARDGLL